MGEGAGAGGCLVWRMRSAKVNTWKEGSVEVSEDLRARRRWGCYAVCTSTREGLGHWGEGNAGLDQEDLVGRQKSLFVLCMRNRTSGSNLVVLSV